MQSLLSLLSVLVLGLSVFVDSVNGLTSLPNPTCHIMFSALGCESISIPGNFTVALIPTSLTEIHLGSSCFSASNGIYCNTLADEAEPFPASLVSLKKVYFKGFRSTQGGDFRFNVLLDKVKGQLVQLLIFDSKIEKLESKCFKGYRSLQSLSIRSGIRDISPDAFAEIADAGVASSLITLYLDDNAILSFDWGVLRPVSASLKESHLNSQRPGLQKVFRSTPSFSLPSINKIRLDHNNLTTISKEVLDTIPGTSRITFGLDQNNFCPDNVDCSCCAMKDLAQWAISRNQQRIRFSVVLEEACGTANRIKPLFWDTWVGLPETVTALTRNCP